MDYSSPYQFDQHWVQRIQKEEKHMFPQNRLGSLDFKPPEAKPPTSNTSLGTRSSCSVDTYSSAASSSASKSSYYKQKYLDLLKETEKEKEMRQKMQDEISDLKKTLSKLTK